MATAYQFVEARLSKLDGFHVQIDEARERADIILNRPPFNIVSMPQRDQLRLVFETLDQRPRHRGSGHRRALLQRRQYRWFHGGDAGDRLEARPEHCLTRTLRQAGDCRQPWLLLRRWFRAFTGLRFPHRFGQR